jgi:tRNA A-37 threonylcarbamoyl transferase component Bud32
MLHLLTTSLMLLTGLNLPATPVQTVRNIRWRVHPDRRSTQGLQNILANPTAGHPKKDPNRRPSKSTLAFHEELVVKSYHPRKFSDLIKNCLRPPRATLDYRKTLLLEHYGLPVAKAVAYGNETNRINGTGFLVMRRFTDSRTMHDCFASGGRPADAHHCGQIIGRLHSHGLRHKDLKYHNLLINSCGERCLVDMEGIRLQILPHTAGLMKDLLHFYRNFQRAGAQPAPGVAAAFWRAYLRCHPPAKRRALIAARHAL